MASNASKIILSIDGETLAKTTLKTAKAMDKLGQAMASVDKKEWEAVLGMDYGPEDDLYAKLLNNKYFASPPGKDVPAQKMYPEKGEKASLFLEYPQLAMELDLLMSSVEKSLSIKKSKDAALASTTHQVKEPLPAVPHYGSVPSQINGMPVVLTVETQKNFDTNTYAHKYIYGVRMEYPDSLGSSITTSKKTPFYCTKASDVSLMLEQLSKYGLSPDPEDVLWLAEISPSIKHGMIHYDLSQSWWPETGKAMRTTKPIMINWWGTQIVGIQHQHWCNNEGIVRRIAGSFQRVQGHGLWGGFFTDPDLANEEFLSLDALIKEQMAVQGEATANKVLDFATTLLLAIREVYLKNEVAYPPKSRWYGIMFLTLGIGDVSALYSLSKGSLHEAMIHLSKVWQSLGADVVDPLYKLDSETKPLALSLTPVDYVEVSKQFKKVAK